MAVSTTINNGPSDNRIDIVVLSEGYTTAQVGATFTNHAAALTNYLFNTGGNLTEPFGAYAEFFNVHLVRIISAESGADNPGTSTTVDTALDSTYFYDGTTERLLYIDDALADAELASALAATDITAEMKFVAVNSTKYGGGGGAYAVFAAGNTSSLEVAVHEVGHSFADLADEYGGDPGPYTGDEPDAVNITKDSTGAKWSRWLGYNQPDIGVIGVYEGGGYYDTGLYRPSNASKMNILNNPFDAIAREAFILKFYELVDPLDDHAYKGQTDTIVDPDKLWVDTIDDSVIDVEWFVDGVKVNLPDVTSVTMSDLGLGPGTYEIKARAYDSTEWVRVADRSSLEELVTWTVAVGQQGTISFEDAVAVQGAADINEVVKNYLDSQISGQATISNVQFSGVGTSGWLILDDVLAGAGIHSGGILLTTGTIPGDSNTSTSFGVNNGSAGDATLAGTVEAAFAGAGTTYDASTIEFTVDITETSVDGIKFDLIFGSDEFPEFSNSQYVDIAAIYVNGQNYALFNESAANPLSILDANLPYFVDNSSGVLPIEWDGVTSKLTIRAPVDPGQNTIKIAIADTGDHVYDSGLYIEDIEMTSGGATTGEPVKSVDGSTGDDVIDATSLKEAFDLLTGSDIISGTLQQLDGDIIINFGDDDIVFLEQLLLELENLKITLGSAIIEIDSDLDGNTDSTISFAGDFQNSSFALKQVNGGTELTVQPSTGDTSDLDALFGASAQNLSQAKGLTAAYVYLGFGVPTGAGYSYLINSNNASNFGAGTGVVFNDENIYINTMNALYQGNANARAAFDLIAVGNSLQEKLTAVYQSIIPPSEQKADGLNYFVGSAAFYEARAAELGIPGTSGAALVGAAALIKIAVDNDIPGIGDNINDLLAAVSHGSAAIPQHGDFTPIEIADGTQFDNDDNQMIIIGSTNDLPLHG